MASATEPGPGVLDLSVRVTNPNAGSPAANMLSTAVVRFSLDVRQAAMQSDFSESQPADPVVAVADEQSARRFLNHRTDISRRGDVEKIFDGWAESFADHVAHGEEEISMEKKPKAARHRRAVETRLSFDTFRVLTEFSCLRSD
ncbi:MAG: hypothetical protein ACFB6R_03300 [Alphaproteobacteria bacterium]